MQPMIASLIPSFAPPIPAGSLPVARQRPAPAMHDVPSLFAGAYATLACGLAAVLLACGHANAAPGMSSTPPCDTFRASQSASRLPGAVNDAPLRHSAPSNVAADSDAPYAPFDGRLPGRSDASRHGSRDVRDVRNPYGTGPRSSAETAIQDADRLANARSNVFGAQLFTGAFSQTTSPDFNTSYVIAVGDQMRLRMWGGFQYDAVLEVDPQGNVFLPHAGPVHVAGIANSALQTHIGNALRRVFTRRVEVYAALESARPVRIYVAGFVRRPGMYDGTSNDSVLRYLDQAGGIDPDRGSFLDVRVKRGPDTRAKLDLYAFLLQGDLPSVPLRDGDVVFVGPRQNTILVGGAINGTAQGDASASMANVPVTTRAASATMRRFEFAGTTTTLAGIAAAARPAAAATHARITRNGESLRNVGYTSLDEKTDIVLRDGDEVTFTSDKRPGTITVRVDGEHEGTQEFVLPYGSRLGELLSQVAMTPRSALADIQLFRDSVKARQKTLLDTQLRNLEAAALTARSGTKEEAELRKEEADLVLRWVERARTIEPLGQVVIGQGAVRDDLLLENGDLIRVPSKDGLVLVGGEVLFPNTLAATPGMNVRDYIAQAGGFTQGANSSRIVVAHRDGTFADGAKQTDIHEGDEVIVLPRVQFKTRQFAKDVFQILFQLAIAAKIAVGIV